jgi:hypothetical protein
MAIGFSGMELYKQRPVDCNAVRQCFRRKLYCGPKRDSQRSHTRPDSRFCHFHILQLRFQITLGHHFFDMHHLYDKLRQGFAKRFSGIVTQRRRTIYLTTLLFEVDDQPQIINNKS